MTTPHHNDIERQLVAELRREAELAMTLTDTPKELRRFQQRMHGNKRRNRIVALAASLAVVAGGIGVAVAVRSGDEGRPQRVVPAGPKPTAPSSSTQHLPNPSTVPSAEVTKLEGPVSVGVAALGAVWATSLEGNGFLHRISLDGRRTLSRTPLDGVNEKNPSPFQVGNAILVANARGTAYVVFDASGKRRGTIPAKVAAFGTGDPTGGWIQTSQTAIARVDASGSRILRSITIPGIEVGAMASAGGSLWVVDSTGSRVLRVDPQTGRSTGEVGVPGVSLLQVVATRGAVFVSSDDYNVRRIDPAQLRVTALLKGDPGSAWPILTVAANGDLWVEPAKGAMAKVNTETLHPERFVTLFRNDRAGGNFGIAVTADRAFITDGDSLTLYSFPLH
jgi:hypothetical protein